MQETNIWQKAATETRTENGAFASNTSNNALLDFFSTVGALRDPHFHQKGLALTENNQNRAIVLFEEAYKVNPLLALKTLFYARDIRGGLGERAVFRFLINYMATHNKYTQDLLQNIHLIAEYGRFDDLFVLDGTSLENEMWKLIGLQLAKDFQDKKAGKPISLLAKWVPTADASSKTTRAAGIRAAKKLELSVYNYKRLYRSLRKYLKVVETQMSSKEWDKISYPEVPSRAMMNYRNAFNKHDETRYQEYLTSVSKGEEKINASTLYPYDIMEKVMYGHEDNATLEAQWKALPDYVQGEHNVMVIADVSGSMWGRPMASSVGLAMYFAERNKGAFHNLFMTFSEYPQFVSIKGNNLRAKAGYISRADWGGSTNLKAAFELILETAIKNQAKPEELPQSLVIISDMEIDYCTTEENRNLLFYDHMKQLYRQNGYNIPNVVFWNVYSRNDVFHFDANTKGVQCFSGSAASTFQNIMKCLNGFTAVDAMLEVLNSERYAAVTLGNKTH